MHLLVPLLTHIILGLPWIRRLLSWSTSKFEHIFWSLTVYIQPSHSLLCYNPLSSLFLLNIVILVRSSVSCMLSLLLFTDLTITSLICFLEYTPNSPITPLGHFKYWVMPVGLSGLTIISLFLQNWLYVWEIATAGLLCEVQTLQCKLDRLTETISVLTDKWWHSFALWEDVCLKPTQSSYQQSEMMLSSC